MRARTAPVRVGVGGRQLSVRQMKLLRTPVADSEHACDDKDNTTVDFSVASIYIAALQSIFSTCACASASVVMVWFLPPQCVSAVRTLSVCVFVGGLFMYRPLKIGRTRGVRFIFSALQPVVAIYLGGLVVEQLLHTCTADPSPSPSMRRVLFQVAMVGMIGAGLLRAADPLRETDLPFVAVLCMLGLVAIFPPPAVALTGPLCEPISSWAAGERLLRAFAFSSSYSTMVYCCTRASKTTSSNLGSTVIVVTRSASATLWILGVSAAWLSVAIAQNALVIYRRVHSHQSSTCGYHSLSTNEDGDGPGGDDDADVDPIQQQRRLLETVPYYAEPHNLTELDDAPAAIAAEEPTGEGTGPPHELRPVPMTQLSSRGGFALMSCSAGVENAEKEFMKTVANALV